MADLDTTSFADDELPIAVRRKRRGSIGVNTQSRSISNPTISRPHGIATPPATPKRSKKRVRFFDSGPEIDTESASSGLTPFIRRTSLATPTSKRRHSTPTRLWNLADDAPLSGTLQFEPLRQVLDGRVKRRLRRNRLSEEVNTIEWDKKLEVKIRKTEVERLRQELAEKDLKMQSMRDEQDLASQIEGESGITVTTTTTLSIKVQELEQEIVELKAKLQERESDATIDDPNWTMAAGDPFDMDDEDEMMITNYDQEFSGMNDELMTTPTRLNTSFPSPPSTMPNTPCKSWTPINAGIQAILPIPDPEKEVLKAQLESLQSEVSKLTSAIAFNNDHRTRLTQKFEEFLPEDENHDHTSLDAAPDSVLTQLALSQSHALEKGHAFDALSTEITSLGFQSCSGPEETLETIAAQFRKARLDLEYLTPGEVVEGFENEKLLDMLVSRIRVLLARVKESDESIDQYHEQELSLRQQLNTRVDALQDIQKELYLANSVVGDLRLEIQEKEVSNERLQKALEGYREEVKGLETLIERMEREEGLREEMLKGEINELGERLQNEICKHDTSRAQDEGKEMIITELERRLNAALLAAADVESQMAALASANEKGIADKTAEITNLKAASLKREKVHGDQLALRDARVLELRNEIQRVNDALKAAHETILALRRENRELQAQVEGEKTRAEIVVQAMGEQMERAQEMRRGFLSGDVSVRGPAGRETERGASLPPMSAFGTTFGPKGGDSGVEESSSATPQTVVRRGRFLDGDLARRNSGGKGKKRRRYDSGMGFLEEEGDVVLGDGELL
jgi:hypothetical protein